MKHSRILKPAPGIAEIKIDHAKTGNRISESMIFEFRSYLEELRNDSSLKVLLLTGRPEVFCAGASSDLLQQLLNGSVRVKDLFDPRMLLTFPVPIIAAMEGPAIGGGLALALGCNLLVGADRARYGFNFASMGFTPELGVTHLLPLRVGTACATEMLMTGKLYTGREMVERGAFDHAVPAEEVRKTAWDLAERMAESPREILCMLKETLETPLLEGLPAALEKEDRMQELCFARPLTRHLVGERYIA